MSAVVKETGNQQARDWEQKRSLRFFMGVNRLVTRVYHHVEVKSPPRIPQRGPAILISNHISGLDPLILQSAIPRPIVWMMAREYYEIRSMSWLFELIEAIPVERSGKDLAAMRSAIRALGSGKILGIFPEGRIETSKALLPFQTGVALLAVKTGVSVYPACVEGNSRGREVLQALTRRCEVQLAFGEEVKIDRSSTSREALQTATASIETAVRMLRQNKLDKLNGL